MRLAEGSEVRRRRGWRRGPMDQEGTAESRRGTRTRVAQEDEGQRSSDGARVSAAATERGPAQQRRSEGQRSGGGVAVRGHRVAGCNVATVTCG